MAQQPTIGILLPYLNAGYDMDVLSGAYVVARQRGARLLAFWGTPGDIHASAIARDHIGGWIAVLNIPKPEGIHNLAETGVPVVIIGALLPGLACPQVLPDNRGGVLAVTRHLIGHGHQRIAFVGDLRIDDVRERYEGYQAALEEAGLPRDPDLVFGAEYYAHKARTPGSTQPVGSQLAAQQIIARGYPCSAVVAANDLSAFHMLKMLQAAGCNIPEDPASQEDNATAR